jgi:RNase P/RNase MRP subunit p30
MDIAIGNNEEFEEIAKKLQNELILIDKNPPLKIIKETTTLSKDIDIIYGLEESKRNDFIHHRNSGLNHILAKELSRKDIIIGFSFNSFLKEGSKVLPRMKQNVRLCRKYKVNMVYASFAKDPYELRSEKDLESFAKKIGMNTIEIKNKDNILKERIDLNKKKKEGKIIAKGVEIIN